MFKVGITGGIGSGKSVVCQVFSLAGVPVFIADNAAKYVQEHNEQVVAGIKDLLGPQVYAGGRLDRAAVAASVFANASLLKELNAIVHPATIRLACEWAESQNTPYVIKEAAIFFESGSYTDMDVMVGVSAPAEMRMQRAMVRGGKSGEQVIAIMNQQMDEAEKMSRCNYVIINDDIHAVIPQVLTLHQQILQLAAGKIK